MALLKKLIIGLAVIIAVFIAVGLFLPSSFHVQRSIVIDASSAEVYDNIVDLEKWQTWGVWFQRDPDMQVTYTGPQSGVGMTSSWKSETQGNGEMTITELEPNQSVTYSLRFPDMDMGSTGKFTLISDDGVTRVIWEDYGDVGSRIMYRYFALAMDSLIGPDFEDGLANLKMVTENQAGVDGTY